VVVASTHAVYEHNRHVPFAILLIKHPVAPLPQPDLTLLLLAAAVVAAY
jgi:hypothetical protein